MGEPTYRLLTGDDLWLASDALPGLLDGWCGPLETRIGATWRPAVMDPFGTRPVWQPTFDAPVHRLDCRRPEVRDHARRVLLAAGHDIGPIIEAELRGDITPTEAAGLVWCSLLRVAAGLGVVCGVLESWRDGYARHGSRQVRYLLPSRVVQTLIAVAGKRRWWIYPDDLHAAGFGSVGPAADDGLTDLGEEKQAADECALFVHRYALRSDGALLLPLPDGVIGRQEVSDVAT